MSNWAFSCQPTKWVEWGGPVVMTFWIPSLRMRFSASLLAKVFHPFLASGIKKLPRIKAAILENHPFLETAPCGIPLLDDPVIILE